MVAFYPSHVFESMGALEQALFESGRAMLGVFERLLRALLSHDGCFARVPAALSAQFPRLLAEYMDRFGRWKIPDERKLVCRLKHALVALYSAHRALPADEPFDSPVRVEIRVQIDRLRGKLRQIGGPRVQIEFDLTQGLRDNEMPGVGEERLIAGELMRTVAHGSICAARASNEQLAHELLIDASFRIQDDGTVETDHPSCRSTRRHFHAVSRPSSPGLSGCPCARVHFPC